MSSSLLALSTAMNWSHVEVAVPANVTLHSLLFFASALRLSGRPWRVSRDSHLVSMGNNWQKVVVSEDATVTAQNEYVYSLDEKSGILYESYGVLNQTEVTRALGAVVNSSSFEWFSSHSPEVRRSSFEGVEVRTLTAQFPPYIKMKKEKEEDDGNSSLGDCKHFKM